MYNKGQLQGQGRNGLCVQSMTLYAFYKYENNKTKRPKFEPWFWALILYIFQSLIKVTNTIVPGMC